MKYIILFLFFSSINAIAQENSAVTLIVSCQGKTQEDAKQAALRSAIEQTFGAFISSKTEIFNDQIVADQMSSVSNGNIKSFEILNQIELPDGRWGVTLKVIVSVDKLTSFVKAKGVVVEIKGGMFALNIKQQLLNEQSEIQTIAEMVGVLHEALQTSFDFTIKSSDPKSLDAESKNWEIQLNVKSICNKNIDFCANYFIKTLSALSLSNSEIETYKSLEKEVLSVTVFYNSKPHVFYLRKKASISAIQSLITNWEFYNRLFKVQSSIDEYYGNGKTVIGIDNEGYSNEDWQIYSISKEQNFDPDEKALVIHFPSNGEQSATFSWKENKTLGQIEQMKSYSVKPRGVISKIKNGGYVVEEKNGHGFVIALFDLGNYNWKIAKNSCDKFIFNGYTDWRLPTKLELKIIYDKLYRLKIICGITKYYYWSSTEININNSWRFNFSEGNFYNEEEYELVEGDGKKNKKEEEYVRPVRTF